MKRPFGVVSSAIILLLFSLLQLLMAFAMALGGVLLSTHPITVRSSGAAPPFSGSMHIVLYVTCVFFLSLAAWGIATAVGLLRLRRWARYSVLVIGGGLALIGFVSALSMGGMMLVSFPAPPTVDASQAQSVQAMTKVAFGVIAFLLAIVSAVGVSWLIYFNRRKVCEVFAVAVNDVPLLEGDSAFTAGLAASGQKFPNSRPFLVSLLAVLNLIGAGFCLLMAALPIPGTIFGLILHGGQKIALYLVFALAQAAIGVGLWQLREWGRRLALGFMALGVVQSLVYVLRPSLMMKYSAEVNSMLAPAQPQLQGKFQTFTYGLSFGFSILFCIALAAVLVYYRAAFQQNEPALSEPPALP